MSDVERQAHWEKVYQTKREDEVSWFQDSPSISLDLIQATGVRPDASIVDIGGGASRLPDALLEAGFSSITVLDLSEQAMQVSRARLGERGATVEWIAADVTIWQPRHVYDVWHDRAAFHFLTDPKDQAAYAERVPSAVRPGGHVIIGTFAPDGPERCSGLPIVRHDAASLGTILGPSFALVETRGHAHRTPMGATQLFQFSWFRRLD
jgi:2-polyprenyl-3-methyl-5-hydroxy-6-metoxy-1,4-benzoquinol methylase